MKLIDILKEINRDKPFKKISTKSIEQHYKLKEPGDIIRGIVNSVKQQGDLATIRQYTAIMNYLKGKNFNLYPTKK